jgi:catechol 2,3-dioxygenase-like lactoylglutathione lyase family enzyme
MSRANPATNPRAEIIGVDHIYLAVRDLARSETFYGRLMPALGFRKNEFTLHGERHVQFYNRHFGFVLRPARAGMPAHDPYAPGLHHLCLRVDTQADVDDVAHTLAVLGIEASAPCLYPEYAPDYYAVFFSDPDGIRLEVTNFRAERRRRFEHWNDTEEEKAP